MLPGRGSQLNLKCTLTQEQLQVASLCLNTKAQAFTTIYTKIAVYFHKVNSIKKCEIVHLKIGILMWDDDEARDKISEQTVEKRRRYEIHDLRSELCTRPVWIWAWVPPKGVLTRISAFDHSTRPVWNLPLPAHAPCAANRTRMQVRSIRSTCFALDLPIVIIPRIKENLDISSIYMISLCDRACI
ncbi:hypothetical protein LXL04_001613 [Taraxacum kok-saghyz]